MHSDTSLTASNCLFVFSSKDITTRLFCRFYLSLISWDRFFRTYMCSTTCTSAQGGAGEGPVALGDLIGQSRFRTENDPMGCSQCCQCLQGRCAATSGSGHRANARYVRLQVEACLRACSSLLLNFHGFDKQAACYYHLMAMFCISF